MTDNIFDFIGGTEGQWRVIQMNAVTGYALEAVSHIKIIKSSAIKSDQGLWTLKGLISNLRYTEKIEKEQLIPIQADLGRPEATCAALIPIRKSDAWWMMAQDERREIFEKRSHHTQTGLKYLPAIARKLYHCRDIGEPFDFITWFEYAPSDSGIFEELVESLRKTEEWKYVDREIEIRLEKMP
jgi:chlorite dismutase